MGNIGRKAVTAVASAILAVGTLAGSAAGSGGFVEDVRVIHAFHGDTNSVYFGWAVSELADIDGDGRTDIIVSDPYRTTGGAVYVYSGRTGALVYRWEVAGQNRYGYSIADGGDANGDGVHDVVIGDPSGNGTVALRSGADGSLLHRFTGAMPGDGLGSAVSSAGDVDRDGHGRRPRCRRHLCHVRHGRPRDPDAPRRRCRRTLRHCDGPGR